MSVAALFYINISSKEELMEFPKEELTVIREALRRARDQSETEALEEEKRILDSHRTAPNENASKTIQEMYNQLLRKIEEAIEKKGA